MSDFKREERYIVVKLKDNDDESIEELREFLQSYQISTQECVVVEPDWPNYADTWQAVEQVANGEYQSPYDLIEELEYFKDHMQEMIKANGFDSVAQLINKHQELATTVERLRLAMMAAICVMPSGQAKADLRDAYDTTPQANLNAIKREVARLAYNTGAMDLWSIIVKQGVKGADVAQIMEKSATEYASTEYPTTEGE